MRHRVRQAMREAGMNQSQLARALDVSPSRMSQIMAGADMNERQLRALCRILPITPCEVVFEQFRTIDGRGYANEAERELLERFRSLPKKAQLLLVEYLKAER